MSSWWKVRLERALRLSPRGWLELAEATLCLSLYATVVRFGKPGLWMRDRQSAIYREPDSALGDSQTLLQAKRLWRRVEWVARHHPMRPKCLAQSLAGRWMLRRRGIAVDLRIGVRLDEGVFSAHAWLESAGQSLDSRSSETLFAPLVKPSDNRHVAQ